MMVAFGEMFTSAGAMSRCSVSAAHDQFTQKHATGQARGGYGVTSEGPHCPKRVVDALDSNLRAWCGEFTNGFHRNTWSARLGWQSLRQLCKGLHGAQLGRGFPLRRVNRRSCAARAEGFQIPAQVIAPSSSIRRGASFGTGDPKEKVEQAMKASQAGQH
jgi:hypothetical protein